jgi:membrane associated rhomboid family serine protease/Flp pilus assembly protein TadD
MAQCVRCGRTLSGFTFGKKICGWCKQHEAAQRGEGSEYQPVMPTPWNRSEAMPMLVTQAIFGINVAVFIGMLLSGASPMSPSGESLIAWGANYGPYTLTGDWWRLVTSCFEHIGIIHLAFNMWCLWSLGAVAERLYGRVTFACVYLLCGISGSLGSLWWHSTPVLSAGASGAIFGIAGAVIASLKLGDYDRAMGHGTMQSLIAFVGYNVVFGAISGRTDNACHFGGLAAGLVLGALIAKAAPEPRLMPRLGVFVLVAAVLGGGAYELQRSRAYPYLLARGGQEIENGKVDAAMPYFDAAIRLRPESASAVHSEAARAYWAKKDYAGAERELQKVLESSPKNEEILVALGSVRIEEHRLAEARQTFAQLLAVNPQSAEAHMGLGDAAFTEGDCVLAEKEYEMAAHLNPQLADAHEGTCLMRQKQYDEAIAAFRKVIQTSGDDESTERSLAEAYRAKGMSAEADAAVQQAEKIKNAQE